MEGQNNQHIREDKRQRLLRRNATDAERELWRHLRGKQIDGAKFRRQHPFGDYILDFACLDRRIVIELDGGQHAESTAYDSERTLHLEQAGFVVLRFWNNEVFENMEGILEVIWNYVTARQTHPHPNPPLEGEGLKAKAHV